VAEHFGYRVVGTITAVKGNCYAGHKVGDEFELSINDAAGLCGMFYHDIYPYIMLFQLGGEWPWAKDKDVDVRECADRHNAVQIELRRIR